MLATKAPAKNAPIIPKADERRDDVSGREVLCEVGDVAHHVRGDAADENEARGIDEAADEGEVTGEEPVMAIGSVSLAEHRLPTSRARILARRADSTRG